MTVIRPPLGLRDPDEETADLYPGMVVCDGRVTGSITLGRSRLPAWAIVSTAMLHGWAEVAEDFEPMLTGQEFGTFLYNLLENRGDFGRLLLALAEAERCTTLNRHWTETKRHRRNVGDLLRSCLALLDELDASAPSAHGEQR